MMTILIYLFAITGALSYLEVWDFGEHRVVVTFFALAVAMILINRADISDIKKRLNNERT